MLSSVMLSITFFMLSITYADYHYTGRRIFIAILNVVMPVAVALNIVILSVIMLNVVMLTAILLSVAFYCYAE
jgi:hypothetical protein